MTTLQKNGDKLLRETHIVIPETVIDMSLTVRTLQEKHDTYGFLYAVTESFPGIDPNIVVQSQKMYLQGVFEGSDQLVKIELPDIAFEDKELIDLFHEICCNFAEKNKSSITLSALAKIGESML